MKTLSNLIRSYVTVYENDVTAGGDETAGRSKAITQLAARLRELSRKNDKYFWICVTLLIVVLIASLGFVIMFRDQPGAIAGVFVALGASAYGGVWKMVNLWREKVATDVVIEIIAVMKVTEAVELLKKVFLDRLLK
jgi:hypothetical protein